MPNHEKNSSGLMDYLLFRRFITPHALRVLLWGGIGGVLYGTWWLFAHDNWAWIMSLVFGTLGTRLVFESFLIRYQTYICLAEIRDKLNEEN